MREHDECCKLSNPCETKCYYIEELEKRCFWEAPTDSQWRIRRQGDVRELNFKRFYLTKTLLDKQKNCFASVNMYYLE